MGRGEADIEGVVKGKLNIIHYIQDGSIVQL